MMQRKHSHRWLLRIAGKALKYLLLGLAGCTVTYVMASILSLGGVASLMALLLEKVAVRALVIVFCLGSIAAITESI